MHVVSSLPASSLAHDVKCAPLPPSSGSRPSTALSIDGLQHFQSILPITLSFLTLPELMRVRSVSKLWHDLSNSRSVWYERRLPERFESFDALAALTPKQTASIKPLQHLTVSIPPHNASCERLSHIWCFIVSYLPSVTSLAIHDALITPSFLATLHAHLPQNRITNLDMAQSWLVPTPDAPLWKPCYAPLFSRLTGIAVPALRESSDPSRIEADRDEYYSCLVGLISSAPALLDIDLRSVAVLPLLMKRFATIFTSAPPPPITSLSVICNHASNDAQCHRALACFPLIANLQLTIMFYDQPVSYEVLNSLRHCHLKSFSLRVSFFATTRFKALLPLLTAVGRISFIKSLTIENTAAASGDEDGMASPAECWVAMYHLLHCHQLTSLTLQANVFQAMDDSSVFALRLLPKLQHISIGSTKLTPALFGMFESFPSLERVELVLPSSPSLVVSWHNAALAFLATRPLASVHITSFLSAYGEPLQLQHHHRLVHHLILVPSPDSMIYDAPEQDFDVEMDMGPLNPAQLQIDDEDMSESDME